MITKDDISDRELRRQARERFAVAERLEAEYLRALRQLTKQIDSIVKGMAPGGQVRNSIELQNVLKNYSRAIEPWAKSVAAKMVARIARKEESVWFAISKTMNRNLRDELVGAPIGPILRQFLEEQAKLITSLPIDAANRVHDLTLESMLDSSRADYVAKEILKTGQVTQSRAALIARTEIARTTSGLTLTRAQHVGVTHYVWRTSGDSDVRESHKKMNGAVIPIDTPPLLSDGTRTHAGMIYNCRCFPDPIIED